MCLCQSRACKSLFDFFFRPYYLLKVYLLWRSITHPLGFENSLWVRPQRKSFCYLPWLYIEMNEDFSLPQLFQKCFAKERTPLSLLGFINLTQTRIIMKEKNLNQETPFIKWEWGHDCKAFSSFKSCRRA